MEKSCFEEDPLGIHGLRNKSKPNMIDKFNDFWVWQNDIRLWGKLGRPNPFDDSDISIVQFMRINIFGS